MEELGVVVGSEVVLQSIIKYYEKISDMAIENLKQEKNFQFRKHLTNHSLLKVVESHYEGITKTPKARKLIKDYMQSMNNMYFTAMEDYKNYRTLLKSTKDPIAKQQLIDQFAEKGITGFVAKNGAKWNIETYSNMCTTHFNNELIRLSVLETVGPGEKVKVSRSPKPCPKCIPYEDKVLTLIELEEAKKKGLFHVRCIHFVTKVVE